MPSPSGALAAVLVAALVLVALCPPQGGGEKFWPRWDGRPRRLHAAGVEGPPGPLSAAGRTAPGPGGF